LSILIRTVKSEVEGGAEKLPILIQHLRRGTNSHWENRG